MHLRRSKLIAAKEKSCTVSNKATKYALRLHNISLFRFVACLPKITFFFYLNNYTDSIENSYKNAC